MSIHHYRVVDRATFFDTLGLRDWGLQRLPHSRVATADVILRDHEGVEVGRFELRYDLDGDAAPAHHLIPAADPETLRNHATLWL